jgi:HEAT repeats
MVGGSKDDKEDMSGQAEDASLTSLVAELEASDGIRRRDTRERLVEIGRPAGPALITALASPSRSVRWEAAKALGQIRDPRATPALVDALEDVDPAVRWLAAGGLLALGQQGLVALLEALEQCSDSLWLREGAHHVLHTLIRDGLADEAVPVLQALEDIEPAVETPTAAQCALLGLRQRNPWQRSG